jgi:cell division septation protein DedD
MSEDTGKKSGMNWLAMSLLSLLIAAAAGAAYLYVPALMPKTSTDIVMIRAEEGPFKTKPANPGGKIITNQDSKVMKMLGDLTPETEEVETLLPPSGAPELPPVAVETTPEVQLGDDSDSETAGRAGTETDTRTEIETAAARAPDNGTPTQLAEKDAQDSGTDVGVAAPAETKPAAEKPAKTIVATPKPVNPESKPITMPRVAADPNEPTYMVQLAAFRKEDVAAEQAGLLLNKHEKRLQGATLGTIRIDTGENGIFWRVVSEPLPREAADTICASLKRAGQDCILRKFTSPSQ